MLKNKKIIYVSFSLTAAACVGTDPFRDFQLQREVWFQALEGPTNYWSWLFPDFLVSELLSSWKMLLKDFFFLVHPNTASRVEHYEIMLLHFLLTLWCLTGCINSQEKVSKINLYSGPRHFFENCLLFCHPNITFIKRASPLLLSVITKFYLLLPGEYFNGRLQI